MKIKRKLWEPLLIALSQEIRNQVCIEVFRREEGTEDNQGHW